MNSTEVAELEEELKSSYAWLNEKYFAGRLPQVPIKITSYKSHAGCTRWKRVAGKVHPPTINIEISESYFDIWGYGETELTLIHEMLEVEQLLSPGKNGNHSHWDIKHRIAELGLPMSCYSSRFIKHKMSYGICKNCQEVYSLPYKEDLLHLVKCVHCGGKIERASYIQHHSNQLHQKGVTIIGETLAKNFTGESGL